MKYKGITKTIDTVSVNAFSNPMNQYRASAPQYWSLVHTRAALSFDYDARMAQGTAWLLMQPYFYATDSLVLDAKGMQIESVTSGQADIPLKYTYDSSQIHIHLDRVYTREEQLRLCIKYLAMPYGAATGGSKAITDDRGLYFINADQKIKGKPVQIWTQGETEANSHWLPTIDKPNSRTTLQLELKVPLQYKTLSNGALISSMEKGDFRTDIWRVEEPIQVYAIMFAIGDFAVVKDQWKGKEVNYYVEPAYKNDAARMFQYTPEMIDFFSTVTGVPYPWNKYSQVVVRDYVSGAMENTSASLFGSFMNQNAREYADENHEDVVSHELFHQWFGDYVTAESWSNLTVNESFATYGEYLWRKHKYGLAYADELAYSDLQKYLNYSGYSDPVLVRHYYMENESMFDRVSYQKGGAILHYLHYLIGDSAFYQSMKHYLTRNALHSAEATHWRLAVEEATGQDMNWFFDQWYYRAGHPQLTIQYTPDDAAQKLRVRVLQSQASNNGVYELPLEVALLYGQEKKIVRWHLRKQKEEFSYDYIQGKAPVVVPDVVHVLPGTIQENKTYAQWLIQIQTCDDYISQLQAILNIRLKDISDKDALAIIHIGLNHPIAALREASLSLLGRIDQEAQRDFWKKDIVTIAGNDGNNKLRAMALQILGSWKLKDQKDLFVSALQDSSYLVSGNALFALYQIAPLEAYTQAKQFLNQKANTNLDIKAWAIVADHADEHDLYLFQELVHQNTDQSLRSHLLQDLTLFAIKAQNKASFNSGVDLIVEMIQNTEQKSLRAYHAQALQAIKDHLQEKGLKSSSAAGNAEKMEYVKKVVLQLKSAEAEQEIIKIYDTILK